MDAIVECTLTRTRLNGRCDPTVTKPSRAAAAFKEVLNVLCIFVCIDLRVVQDTVERKCAVNSLGVYFILMPAGCLSAF